MVSIVVVVVSADGDVDNIDDVVIDGEVEDIAVVVPVDVGPLVPLALARVVETVLKSSCCCCCDDVVDGKEVADVVEIVA